jgi:argininosuccinate lyase
MEKKFKFEFTLEEADTILRAVQELPFRKVKSIVDNIISSYENQAKDLNETKKEETEELPTEIVKDEKVE